MAGTGQIPLDPESIPGCAVEVAVAAAVVPLGTSGSTAAGASASSAWVVWRLAVVPLRAAVVPLLELLALLPSPLPGHRLVRLGSSCTLSIFPWSCTRGDTPSDAMGTMVK